MQIYNESKTDTDYSSQPPFLLTNTNRLSESYEFHIFSTFNRLCYTVKKKFKKKKNKNTSSMKGTAAIGPSPTQSDLWAWRWIVVATYAVADIYAQSSWGLGVRHLCAKLVRIGCQDSYYRRGVTTSENRDPSQDEAAGLDLREFVDFCRLC
jgi:hypothetical protein